MSVKINPQEYRLVPVDELRPHPDNPNLGDDGAVLESLGENDFYGAVIVQRSTNYLIAGHTRWRTAKESGLKEIPGIILDVDDERALRIMLADNRTAELAVRDSKMVADVLSKLRDDPRGTGYSEQDAEFIKQQAGIFAAEASRWLGDGDEPDESDDDDDTMPVDDSPATETTWYPLSYTVTKDQRAIVQEAIKRYRSSDPNATSAEALVGICDRYNRGSE